MFLLYCFYFCMVPQSQSLGSVNVTCFTPSKSTKYNLCQTVTASSGHQWPHINVFSSDVLPGNVMGHSSAKETLLTHLPSPLLRNAFLSAMRWRTASGLPLRRPMITASSMRSAMTSLTARPALQERRSVLMDIRVSMNV